MTTPAEKDAMALAVLAVGAQHLRNAKNIKACHLGDAASELEQARAHLAARVAELEKMLVDYEQDYPPTVRALRESTGRATRAEAELAAVLAFLRDDATAISYQSLGQYRKAALDAARGAG